MLKALWNFEKSSEMAKFWPKNEENRFFIFRHPFSLKNENFCFSLETIGRSYSEHLGGHTENDVYLPQRMEGLSEHLEVRQRHDLRQVFEALPNLRGL